MSYNIADENFIITDGVLEGYIGAGSRESGSGEQPAAVRVPEGVTEIGGFAFAHSEGVAEISLPDSVEIIGENAFMGCSGLLKIKMPSSLKILGRAAFRECDLLDEIVIPEGISELPSACFYQCLSLKTVTLPETLDRICPRAFSDCISLECVALPRALRGIEEYAFEYCSKLKEIALPDGLETIDRYAFASCHSLLNVNIPQSVKKIGEGAFYQTAYAESGDEPFLIGSGILFLNRSREPRAELPQGMTAVGEYAFECCETLEEIVIPEGVRELRSCAFKGCGRLTKVKLPESLEVIGAGAFCDCTSLADIELPKGLRSIGSHAFDRTALVNKAAEDRRALLLGGRYLLYSPQIQSPALELPEGTELIAGGAFANLGDSRFKTARLEGVKSVGDEAFLRCGQLEDVYMPDVEHIGSGVFEGCDRLHAYIGCKGAGLTAGKWAFEKGQVITFLFGSENCSDGEKTVRREFTVTLLSDLEERGGGQTLFDFAAEPSGENFAALNEYEYKLAAAVCFYDREGGDVFRSFLRKNIADAVKLATDRADSALLRRTLGTGYLGTAGTAECIDHAIAAKRLEQQVILMRYKQENFGGQTDSELDSRFEW